MIYSKYGLYSLPKIIIYKSTNIYEFIFPKFLHFGSRDSRVFGDNRNFFVKFRLNKESVKRFTKDLQGNSHSRFSKLRKHRLSTIKI